MNSITLEHYQWKDPKFSPECGVRFIGRHFLGGIKEIVTTKTHDDGSLSGYALTSEGERLPVSKIAARGLNHWTSCVNDDSGERWA